jgi:hypothetical protein
VLQQIVVGDAGIQCGEKIRHGGSCWCGGL